MKKKHVYPFFRLIKTVQKGGMLNNRCNIFINTMAYAIVMMKSGLLNARARVCMIPLILGFGAFNDFLI